MTKFSVSVIAKCIKLGLAGTALTLVSFTSAMSNDMSLRANAATINVGFSKLSNLTGGHDPLTAVYRADLSNLGFDLNQITISDINNRQGGEGGIFTGFDLDAIKISTTRIEDSRQINQLPSLNVFNFTNGGAIFTPGVQRQPTAPNLFGTANGRIDHNIATLGSFDAVGSANNAATGFVSLGDGGKIQFNLTQLLPKTGPLYMYIGEVGDNGELATARLSLRKQPPAKVPEPNAIAALSVVGIFLASRRHQHKNPS